MSLSYALANVERTQREIESLHRKLTEEAKKEAARIESIYRIRQSITRSTTTSTRLSKQREITRHEQEIVQIQKRRAEVQRQLAGKTKQLHDYQREVTKLQATEQKKGLALLQRRQEDAETERRRHLTEVLRHNPPSGPIPPSTDIPQEEYDAFISHATEDKEALVRPLADLLVAAGMRVWYDDFELTVGDSLRESIDRGLANSRFGIVVLSPAFFAKGWTNYELNGLVAREVGRGGKLILPIWHNLSKDEVMKHSPSLADKFALRTATDTVEELAKQLVETMA